MPPKRSMKPRRKAAPKAKKAYKKPKAKGGRKPVASKVTVRQQNLGQQTENKVVLYHGIPDSRAKVMKAVSPLCHYVDTVSGALTTEGFNGRQCWGYIDLAGAQDLMDIGTLLAQQNTKNTGFSPPNPNPATVIPPAQYLLTRLEHNLKISNLGQATVRLSVIHCRSKRDVYNNNDYTSPNAQTYQWGSIVEAIQQGVSASRSEATSSDNAYLIPGVDETESPIFNKYFKKLKTTEIFLAVGGTHTLSTNCLYDRVMDATLYGNEQIGNILGITDVLLLKAEGQTGVTNPAEPSPLSPPITIAPCQVGWTANWDYSFVQVTNARKFMKVTDAITATETVVTVISGATGSGVNATGLIV